MLINYCDLCGSPLKENNFTTLYVNNPNNPPPDSTKFDNIDDYSKAYNSYILRLQRDVKEICPSCRHLFNKIFEYRLEGMAKLTEDCRYLFNLPTKNPAPYNSKTIKIKLNAKDIDNLIQEKKIIKKYFANTVELEMK